MNPSKQNVRQPSSDPGLEKIVSWSGYESFRTAGLVFLVVLNILVLIGNIGLFIGAAFAPVLAVVCVLLAAGGIYWAIQVAEDTQKHFKRSAAVQRTFAKAPEAAVSGSSWLNLLRTVDGWLFGLAMAQSVLMLVQLWHTLHP